MGEQAEPTCPSCGTAWAKHPGPIKVCQQTRQLRDENARLRAESLRGIQAEQVEWVAHNFGGDRPAWHPLLGVQEEVGELAHAYLKRTQGIRVNENHDAAIRDAVADIVIYLLDFCTAEGIDLQSVLAETWAQVRGRDWKQSPETGMDAT